MPVRSLIMILALALPVWAFGSDVKAPKIAYVDTETALNNSKEYKDCSLALLDIQDEKEEELRKMTSEIDALGDKLKILSDAKRQQEEANYQALIARASRFAEDTDKSLREQRSVDLNRIANKLKAVIEDIGKDGKYTLIIDLKAIVYLDRSEMKDLTDDVVLKLNEAYAKEKERLLKTPNRVK
ncbi:OmpH family outer membrane protein [bacterium]|nr:OmpH family outer membrane protein [bacterium]